MEWLALPRGVRGDSKSDYFGLSATVIVVGARLGRCFKMVKVIKKADYCTEYKVTLVSVCLIKEGLTAFYREV